MEILGALFLLCAVLAAPVLSMVTFVRQRKLADELELLRTQVIALSPEVTDEVVVTDGWEQSLEYLASEEWEQNFKRFAPEASLLPATTAEVAPAPTVSEEQPAPQTVGQSMPVQTAQSSQECIEESRLSNAMSVRTTTENLIGRNVLGIAASILVFLGLVFLGGLVYEHLTDGIKVALMFAISAIIIVPGIVLGRKTKNAFTTALTGCGCGSFFISILLTHIYFEMLNDVAAFSLLLVWMIIALCLAKWQESVSLSVVAHIGMIFSLCFAYAAALSDDKLLLLLVYQATSTAAIIIGNILCCKRTYRFGLFASLLLTIVASAFMWGNFQMPAELTAGTPFGLKSDLPTWVVATAFIVQFVGASFLSYLLSVSTNRLKNEETQWLSHVGNKLLWVSAFFANVYAVVWRLVYVAGSVAVSNGDFFGYMDVAIRPKVAAAFTAGAVGLVVLVLHIGLTIFVSKKLGLKKILETISVVVMSTVISVLLFILWATRINPATPFGQSVFPNLLFLFIPALILIITSRLAHNRIYLIAANICFALDLLFMLAYGYQGIIKFEPLSNLTGIILAISYMLMYFAVIWIQWWKYDSEIREKYLLPARFISYLTAEASLVVIFLSSEVPYTNEVLLLVLTTLHLLLFLTKYDKNRESSNPVYLMMRANEIVLVLINAFVVAFFVKDATLNVLHIILFVLTVALAFVRVKELFFEEVSSLEEVWSGIKLTILTLAVIHGYTILFDEGAAYMLSLICMVTALVCIIAGFASRKRHLRLYGLVLTLICVLKLVTYDVADLDTYLRVIALIGGGVICFIISAIYSYSTKKMETRSLPEAN